MIVFAALLMRLRRAASRLGHAVGGLGRAAGRLGHAAADLALGSVCAGCGEPPGPLCPRCRAGLLGPASRVRTVPARPDLPLAGAATYAGAVRAAIIEHKERGRLPLARPLGDALAIAVTALLASDDGCRGPGLPVDVAARRTPGVRVERAVARGAALGRVAPGGPPGLVPGRRAEPGTPRVAAPHVAPAVPPGLAPRRRAASAAPRGAAPGPVAPGGPPGLVPGWRAASAAAVRGAAPGRVAPGGPPGLAPGRRAAPGSPWVAAPGRVAPAPPGFVPHRRGEPAAAPLGAAPGHLAPGGRVAPVASAGHRAGDPPVHVAHGDRPVVLVPVPSSPAAVRHRGHDPVLRTARRAAATLRRSGQQATVVAGLRHRRRVADQAGLDRRRRERNLHGALAVTRAARRRCRGACVVVVDDIVTTGATLREAGRALEAAGLRPCGAAVIAMV